MLDYLVQVVLVIILVNPGADFIASVTDNYNKKSLYLQTMQVLSIAEP